MSNWEVVIGLEVHCQLKTQSKLFSGCSFQFGCAPNRNTDAYTWGQPGTLPVPTQQVVNLALRLALATKSKVQNISRFARKHYFYPDLPKGYQITQADSPYAVGGEIHIPNPDESEQANPTIPVRLVRIHIEEDAGKNTHVPGKDISLVDYNRAGVPLLEIVSEPDLRSAAHAAAYMRELRAMVRYLDISDANMEQGSLRCDANVSLRPKGSDTFGTRCEIKNLNSFKFLEAAILAEVRRQTAMLEKGEPIVQSTLSYDPNKDQTAVMRIKEDAADYRYMPDPDLPPLLISDAWVQSVAQRLPELPAAKRIRYTKLELSTYDRNVLIAEPSLAAYFDQTVEAGAPAKEACNWITGELLARLNADGKQIEQSLVKPAHVAQIIGMVANGDISRRAGKEVFDKCYREGLSAQQIVERDNYVQISDQSVLRTLMETTLQNNQRQVDLYRQGKRQLRGYFVGQIMKASKGQANPQVVNQLLEELLPPVEEE